METRGAPRSSPLSRFARFAELVPACGGGGCPPQGSSGRSGPARRWGSRASGVWGARRGPAPRRPACARGRLSAGGYRGGTGPCCRACAAAEAPAWRGGRVSSRAVGPRLPSSRSCVLPCFSAAPRVGVVLGGGGPKRRARAVGSPSAPSHPDARPGVVPGRSFPPPFPEGPSPRSRASVAFRAALPGLGL